MFGKETFIDTINFLEIMVKEKKKNKETILLIKKIFTLLPLFFTDYNNAKIEIEHYCYDTNFGKPSLDSEYITPGDLYEKLI
jgi:hypothetical protein